MGLFLNELKRRKVLRVAVAYVVAAWVLLQVAELLMSVLELPIWTARLVLVLLLIGFVPALILAWAYDLTPDGIKLTPSDGQTIESQPAMAKTIIGGVIGAVLVAAIAGAYWFSGKDERWVRNVAVPQIDGSIADGDMESAYAHARDVLEVDPDNGELAEMWGSFAWKTTISSRPEGATVYRRAYSDEDAEWQELGVTPLHDIHIPYGASLLRMENEGYEPLLRVIGGGLLVSFDLAVEEKPRANWMNVHPEIFELETKESIPEDMVRVPAWDELVDGQLMEFRDYYLGRHEVTNREFQSFVDAGGYERPDLWEHTFLDDGQEIGFDKAMALFTDRTGRHAPSTWEAGTFPNGHDEFPVSGVSWYEAAAYARFVGQELPTIHHWRRGLAIATLAWQLPASNLDGQTPAAVGDYPGIGWTGTYDMAGNVREWCLNESDQQKRVIIGAGWDEAMYMVEASYSAPHSLPPLDRSETNGFRLAKTNDTVASMQRAIQPELMPQLPKMQQPVSDEVFAASLSDFEYDRTPLNPQLDEPHQFRHWTRQRITIDTPDGDDRIVLYLHLPNRQSSRYQTILFWPGAAAMYVDSIDEQHMDLEFALRNGRAVLQPVLKGMLERRLNPTPEWSTHKGRDLAFKQLVELRRAIDYLETRPDIDTDNIAYFGRSWGGRVGAMVLSVEPRIKVGVLNQAGVNSNVHPDMSSVNFLPRVQTPVLVFSGRFDSDFPFDTSSKPFYDLIGTPEPDKKHIVDPSGHFVNPVVAKGETLDWLDHYLGKVQ